MQVEPEVGMNNKGQTILAEYVMIFFVVIAAATAMTTFVQRGFEARVHDTRDFAINSVLSNSVCDANCVRAAGGNIFYEYEPYYAAMTSDVQQNQASNTEATAGNIQVIGGVYRNSLNEATTTNSVSYQLPPACANGGC
jgi:uncharacterized protein (UPF0333 family)